MGEFFRCCSDTISFVVIVVVVIVVIVVVGFCCRDRCVMYFICTKSGVSP